MIQIFHEFGCHVSNCLGSLRSLSPSVWHLNARQTGTQIGSLVCVASAKQKKLIEFDHHLLAGLVLLRMVQSQRSISFAWNPNAKVQKAQIEINTYALQLPAEFKQAQLAELR